MDHPPMETDAEDRGWLFAGTTARGLVDALLSGDQERLRILTALLVTDRAFADWAVRRAGQIGHEAGNDAPLASHMSSRLLSFLAPLAASRASESADGRASESAPLAALVAQQLRLLELETRFQTALETEKLAALKQLAYGASHEINNPLANISTRAQTLLRDEQDPERRRKLATINSQAFRAHEMIADLMLFAQPPALHYQYVDVVQTIDRVVSELADWAGEQATQLIVATPETPLFVWADPNQLAVAIKAMCINALEALRSGGQVEIAAAPRHAALDVQDVLQISVRDNGPGITPEVRRHLFDPFFSGREAGRGLGVGLSKCWRIVQQHGGELQVESEPGHGATFLISLPVRRNETAA